MTTNASALATASEQHTAPKWSARIPELDGIRGSAIAMVLLWHYLMLGPRFSPTPGTFLSRLMVWQRLTWTGVDLFFVLSGFLIGGILIDARKSDNYFRVFYTRRFFRIVPVYLTVLVICPLLLRVAERVYLSDYSFLNSGSGPWYCYLTFTQNFWMAGANTIGSNMLSITWSLAIEEQFYLVLPLLVRFLSEKSLLILVVTGICLAPIFRTAILFASPGNSIAPFVLLPCRADALLLGVLATILLRKEQYREVFRKSGRYFAVVFALLLCGLAVLAFRFSYPFWPVMQGIGYSWVAFFYATVLVFALTRRDGLVGRFFRNSLLRRLGTLAYCTYLIHQTVQGLVFALILRRPPKIDDMNGLLCALGSLFMTLLVASVSWRYFESRLIGMGHRVNYGVRERQPISLSQLQAG